MSGGGPRKEWLRNNLKAATTKLVKDRVSLAKPASLESKEYYCQGVMMGKYLIEASITPATLCCRLYLAV